MSERKERGGEGGREVGRKRKEKKKRQVSKPKGHNVGEARSKQENSPGKGLRSQKPAWPCQAPAQLAGFD